MKRHIKTRDWSMVRIIQGATKAAVHVDQRKQASRDACRTGGSMDNFDEDWQDEKAIAQNPPPADEGDDEDCDEDYSRDYGPGGAYEDPFIAYERERAEYQQELYEQWRNEY